MLYTELGQKKKKSFTLRLRGKRANLGILLKSFNCENNMEKQKCSAEGTMIEGVYIESNNLSKIKIIKYF